MELNSKEQIIAYSASYPHRQLGFTVVDQYPGDSSHSITLQQQDHDQLKVYVTVTKVSKEAYSLSVILEGESTAHSFGRVSDFSDELRSIKSPTSVEALDLYYSSLRGEEWARSIPSGIVSYLEASQSFKARAESDMKSFEPAKLPKAMAEQLGLFISSEPGDSTRVKPLPESIPKFDDEYEILGKTSGQAPRGTTFPSIGDSDLYPGGEKYPSLDPMGTSSKRPFNGMVPGKNHPLFGQTGGAPTFRGDHPLGSRYDDPMGGASDLDSEGMGLPRGSYRRDGSNPSPFDSPFSGSGGFGGAGFI